MTKKSPARVKVAEKNQSIDLESYFKDAKNGLKLLIDTKIRILPRIDNFINMTLEMRGFDLEPTPKDVKEALDIMKDTLMKIREIIDDLEYSDFTEKEMDDPFADLVSSWFDENDFLKAFLKYITYSTVKPYGEKIEGIHSLIIDELSKQEK